MAVGDIYEITDKATLFEQEVNNVYFYRQNDDVLSNPFPTVAQALAGEFQTQVLPKVTICQSDDVVHQEIKVRNLFNPADSYSKLISVAGGQASADAMPSFNAVSFTMSPETSATGKGGKRIAGFLDSWVTDGVVTSQIAQLNAYGTQLATPIQYGAISPQPIFDPVIVKRVVETIDGILKYRLPENSAEAIFAKCVVAVFNVLISSQLSRKIGKGR